MAQKIISVEMLSKRYLIGHKAGSKDGLRHALESAARSPFAWLANREKKATNSQEEFWALKNVSFEINQGQVVGIVGRNGAGKSTLLKVLSRITQPTSGRIHLRGRVASLLEVGTGFHPELTGRENIFLNGAILGMTKLEINKKFDEIVAFSEVEKYLDTPVKRYSSGMYVRLAFAVAAHMEPEILIIDEVLAVGDASFQKKCLGKMEDVAKGEGRTVLFVSHNMGMVSRLCSDCILLESGQLALMDSTEAVVARYLNTGAETESEQVWTEREQQPGNNKIKLRAVRVTDTNGDSIGNQDIRRPFCIEIHYEVLQPMSDARIGFRLLTSDGTVVFSSVDSSSAGSHEMPRKPGHFMSRCEIPGNLLNEGFFSVTVAADIPFIEVLFFKENVVSFHVEQTGGPGTQYSEKWQGVIRPSLFWEVRGTDNAPIMPTISLIQAK